MVLPDEVVQVGLVEELIPVDVVKKPRQPDKRPHGQHRETDPVPGEKAFIGNYGPIRVPATGYQPLVAIDVEIEHETEYNRVYLEVNG